MRSVSSLWSPKDTFGHLQALLGHSGTWTSPGARPEEVTAQWVHWKSGGKAAPLVELIPVHPSVVRMEQERRWWASQSPPESLAQHISVPSLFELDFIHKISQELFFFSIRNFLYLRKNGVRGLLLQSQIISMCSGRGFWGREPPEWPPGSSPTIILCHQHIFSWSVMVMLLLEINLLPEIHPISPIIYLLILNPNAFPLMLPQPHFYTRNFPRQSLIQAMWALLRFWKGFPTQNAFLYLQSSPLGPQFCPDSNFLNQGRFKVCQLLSQPTSACITWVTSITFGICLQREQSCEEPGTTSHLDKEPQGNNMAWKCCSGQYLPQSIFIALAFYFSTCTATGRMHFVGIFFMEFSRETEFLIEVGGAEWRFFFFFKVIMNVHLYVKPMSKYF